MSPPNVAKVFFLPFAKSIAPPDTMPDKMPFTAHRPDRLRATVLPVALLLYAGAVALYFPIVKRTSGTWEARRRELISASPVVYVAPYGTSYHQYKHYGRLSSPLSLYEATERQYERCTFCASPPPANLLASLPWYVAHPVLTVMLCSWLYLVLLLIVFLVMRRRGMRLRRQQRRA